MDAKNNPSPNKPTPIEQSPRYTKVMQVWGALCLGYALLIVLSGDLHLHRTAFILALSGGVALVVSGRLFAWWDRG